MFDAYTVKKVMPRLVIAAILIQLSWPLVTTLINVVTQLSWGLEGLMYLPFGGRSQLNISNSLSAAGGEGSLTALLAGGTLWGLTGAPGLLALAIAILMALLTAFVTLIFRQIILILLVLTAPLAIVAWILPNTERLWKMWWGTFSKALLMYPLILLLFAGGRIGAHLATVDSNSGGPGVAKLIIVLVIFFAPYFLIAKTFQFAGGALAMVGGAIAARGSKMSAWANKRSMAKQGQKWGVRAQKAKDGELTPFKSVNALTARATTKNFGLGRKGRSAYTQKKDLMAAQFAKTDSAQAGQFDDGMLRAQTYRDASEARARMAEDFGMNDEQIKDAISAARANGGWGVNRQWHAAQQLARTKTGYGDAGQAQATIDRVAGNNAQAATSLRENIKFTSKQVGRNDLGALSSQQADESHSDWVDRMTLDGMATADDATLARMHTKGMENVRRAVTNQHGSGSALSGQAQTVAEDLIRARDWANRGNKGAINEMGGLDSGQTISTGTEQVVSPNPDEEGELIINTRSTGSKDATIAEYVDSQRRGGVSPDDPSSPTSSTP